MEQSSTNDELPLGFAMALAHDIDAMNIFSAFPDREQQAVIQGARSIRSKREMEQYVDTLKNRQAAD